MKKLLVLAAVIVAGVTANAASFQWTAANFYGPDGTTTFTGNVDIYAYASTAALADATLVTSASITSGSLNKTYDWTDAEVGTTYNFYLVVTDGDKVFNSSSSNPAVIKSGAAVETGTSKVLFANMAPATQAAGSWAAVPEPTSGLLLLLGMAGLALKRKRA